MWTCPLCQQQFVRKNQSHSCGEKEIAEFLRGKSAQSLSLFDYFSKRFKEIGQVTIHPTKSMIAFAAKTRIAFVIRLAKDHIDVVFPFTQPYHDNLCFHKIAQVPGTKQYNHHFRMYSTEDINEEVIGYLKLAYQSGLR